MHRVLITPEAVRGRSIAIRDPRTLHHLRDVVRVKTGDRLECFDSQGHRYAGPVTHCGKRELIVAIESRAKETPPSVRLTLAQALIRPERFEWVLQKATELGVAQIIPVVASRSTVRLGRGASFGREQRFLRWRRIEGGRLGHQATTPV